MIDTLLPWIVAPFFLVLVSCDNGRRSGALDATRLDLASTCNVEGGCLAQGDGLSVRLSLGPDAQSLRPFPVRVQVGGDNDIAEVTVAFSMQGMEMGLNRYLMQSEAGGRWTADVTLPVCTSGRSDWVARFELADKERRYIVDMPFTLEK